jgi:phospholipase/carboxylesterase
MSPVWDSDTGDRSGLRYVIGHRPARPAGALVLLHGRGADERDLLPLLDDLDPGRDLVGLTLGAPLRLSQYGYHWYIVRELGFPDTDTFLGTYELASEWLDHLPELTGVPFVDTVVGGFSQGAVMAYALTLGRGRPSPAALIALSGFIPRSLGFALDPAGHRDVPVAIGHGALDPVIPVRFGRSAAQELRRAGLSVEYRESPLPHSIDPAFVQDLARWIPPILERRRAA